MAMILPMSARGVLRGLFYIATGVGFIPTVAAADRAQTFGEAAAWWVWLMRV